MATGSYIHQELLPFAAMVTAESVNVGTNILYKAAVSKGLSYHVFMVYSYAISALILIPLSYLFHRKTPLPPFTLVLLGKLSIVGFLGFIPQYLGYRGILYSSPTLGSAMSNITPASTFILAIIFRMEKLKLRSFSSQAKIIGTIVTIAGAFVVVLCEGPILINSDTDHKLEKHILSNVLRLSSAQSNWIVGGALLAASYVVVAIWYIYQAKIIREYPAELVLVFFYNLFACVVAVPICFASEPDLSSWKVPADVQLLSIVYSGIMGTALAIVIHTWGLHVKGPVYVALFRPLSIAITAISGVIFLHDNLYLGSVIGSIIISMGFYTVIWGKSKEETTNNISNDCSLESPNDATAPMLKHYKISAKGNTGL